jgi:hypothetical protein
VPKTQGKQQSVLQMFFSNPFANNLESIPVAGAETVPAGA